MVRILATHTAEERWEFCIRVGEFPQPIMIDGKPWKWHQLTESGDVTREDTAELAVDRAIASAHDESIPVYKSVRIDGFRG